MSLLSKPYKITFHLLGSYISQLYMNPIRTKSITSLIIASLANYTAQRLSGAKAINQDSLAAFGIFGLLFGGSIPHLFYELLSKIISRDSPYALIQQLLIERLIFMPLYTAFSLYMISRLEGKTHDEAVRNLVRTYFPIVQANLKYLTILQHLNIYYVPPLLRVLVSNVIGFFWVIYIAHKRATRKA